MNRSEIAYAETITECGCTDVTTCAECMESNDNFSEWVHFASCY